MRDVWGGSSLASVCTEVKGTPGFPLSDLPAFMLPDKDGGEMWVCPVQPAFTCRGQLLQLPAAPQLE